MPNDLNRSSIMPDSHLPWTFDEGDFHIRDSAGNTLARVSLGYPAYLPVVIVIGHTLARAAEFLDLDLVRQRDALVGIVASAEAVLEDMPGLRNTYAGDLLDQRIENFRATEHPSSSVITSARSGPAGVDSTGTAAGGAA